MEKIRKFEVIFVGDNPPTTAQILEALLKSSIDEGGMLTVKRRTHKKSNITT